MSKNNSSNTVQEDYYKSLNKIMILGLTGMAALGTSMLFIESTKTNALTLLKTRNIFNLTNKVLSIKRSPALAPIKVNIVSIRSFKKLPISTRPLTSKGSAPLSMNKKFLSPTQKQPLIIKTENKKYLKPKK